MLAGPLHFFLVLLVRYILLVQFSLESLYPLFATTLPLVSPYYCDWFLFVFITTNYSLEIKTLNTEPTTPTIHETTISITTENTKTTDSILETTTATTTTPQDTINDTTKEGEGKGEPVESEDEQTLRTRRYYGHRIFIATRTEDYALVFKYCMEMKQVTHYAIYM